MTVAFVLMTVLALLGALDNLWHHEVTERLATRRSAAPELSLHAVREVLYAFVLLAFAWFEWRGLWAAPVSGILLIEVPIVLMALVVEDRTRRLRASERVLHTLLAINYGALLATLAPALLHWWSLPSAIVGVSHSFSWMLTFLGAGAFFWSLRNALAVLRLRRPPEWVRNPIPSGSSGAGRTVLVSGGTGFIAQHLVRRLLVRGDKVIVLTRRPEVALDRFGPHVRVVTDLDELDADTRIDVMVNLAGSPLFGLPWTRVRREQLLRSRIETTRAMTALAARLSNPVKVFISASATGFYGIGGDEVVDEQGRPMPIFQSQLCQDWEAAARAAARLGVRLVRLRIGLVLGADGGALPFLALPVRLGLGAILGTGRQWISWIHVDDLTRLLEFAIDTPLVRGALNAVAPTPVTHRQLQGALARILRRFVWLRIPGFLVRLLLGEMAQLLVDGRRVVSVRASAWGFRFNHPRLDEALLSILRPAAPDLTSADVYFNGDCTVWGLGMEHYATLCQGVRPDVRFVDAMRQERGLAACALRREHLERRVYLRRADGLILSGMPAIIAIWASLPRYRLLARLASLPILRQLSVALYDHVISPGLAFWTRRRAAQGFRVTGGPQGPWPGEP